MRLTRKTILYILVCLLVMTAVLPVSVSAAQRIQTDAQAALTIVYKQDDTPLTGARFQLYRVAELSEAGVPTPTTAFSRYEVDYTNLDAAAVQTLLGYAQLDGIEPDLTLSVDDKGNATAENVAVGMYLIAGERHNTEAGSYTCTPMAVSVPMAEEDGSWNYLISVLPKAAFEPKRETVERKVLKVWEDRGQEDSRPESIEVSLLRDGKVQETLELSEENNWRYTWSGLDASHTWTIVETPVDGYIATHETKGITTVITNTPDIPETSEPTEPSESTEPTEPSESTEPTEPSEPDEPELPETGMLWWPIPLMAAFGLLLIAAGFRMRRGDRYET